MPLIRQAAFAIFIAAGKHVKLADDNLEQSTAA